MLSLVEAFLGFFSRISILILTLIVSPEGTEFSGTARVSPGLTDSLNCVQMTPYGFFFRGNISPNNPKSFLASSSCCWTF